MEAFRALFSRPRRLYRQLNSHDGDAKIGLTDIYSQTILETRDQNHYCCRSMRWHKSRFASASFMLSRFMTVFNVLFLIANMAIFAKVCQKHRSGSQISPMWRNFPTETKPTSIDLSFYTDTDDSGHIYRRMPSPEVDEAWRILGQGHDILIDQEEVERAGVDIRSAMKIPKWMMDSLNITGDRYLAKYDANHHLHCLDYVRQALFPSYYYGPEALSDPFRWPHVMHCLDTVRQSLMCHATAEVLVMAWGERQPGVWMDRTQKYQCTDWDAIQTWVREREIPEGLARQIGERPAGTKDIPMQKEWWALLPAIHAHMDKYPEIYADFVTADHEHKHHH